MSRETKNNKRLNVSKVIVAIGAVLVLIFMTYACQKKKEAEQQREQAYLSSKQARISIEECIKSRETFMNTIDSLHLQIEDFEMRMNKTKFSDYVIYSDSVEEN